jgi:hypothetical protein
LPVFEIYITRTPRTTGMVLFPYSTSGHVDMLGI